MPRKLSDEILEKLIDRHWLYNQYWVLYKSSNQIAEELGCSQQTILNYLRRSFITIRRFRLNRETRQKLKDKDWLYEQYWKKKRTLKSISKELRCSITLIRRSLIYVGIETRGSSFLYPVKQKLNDKDWLYEQYWKKGKTLEQIAETLGCHYSTIFLALKKLKIPRSKIKIKELTDKDWLYNQYWEMGKTIKEIAEELGCSFWTIRNAMVKLKIPRSKIKIKELTDKDWLYNQYWEMGKTTHQIAEELGCSHNTIWLALKRFKIERR